MGSMSRGMARLSKHESVRVPRKRTSVTIETLNRSAASSASTKGTFGRKNAKKLSLTSFSFIDYDKSSTSLQDESTPTTTSYLYLKIRLHKPPWRTSPSCQILPLSFPFLQIIYHRQNLPVPLSKTSKIFFISVLPLPHQFPLSSAIPLKAPCNQWRIWMCCSKNNKVTTNTNTRNLPCCY
jgi:hypothetical protein